MRFTRASDIPPVRRRQDWGPWQLDRNSLVLFITEPSGYRYEVDLERCLSSAEVLDWICQIAGKDWTDDSTVANATLAGLVRAINDVLNPQAHLCSSGQSKRLDPRQIAELVRKAPR